MKLYICEDYKNKWQSQEFAEMSIRDYCGYTGEKKADFVFGKFEKNEYGKPFIKNINKNLRNVHFSLSHSGDILICAVSRYNIGADCQIINITDIERCRKIAGRFFSPDENIFLNRLPEENYENYENYINHFFEIWTKKEAYIKYTGKGFAEGLSTFSVNHLDGVYFRRVAGVSNAYIYVCCDINNKADLQDLQVKYVNV